MPHPLTLSVVLETCFHETRPSLLSNTGNDGRRAAAGERTRRDEDHAVLKLRQARVRQPATASARRERDYDNVNWRCWHGIASKVCLLEQSTPHWCARRPTF
jgi:hypothetical protein